MTLMITPPEDSLEAWTNELKPYQRKIITQLLIKQNNDIQKVAESWLTISGSPSIIAFGGIKTSTPFWQNFRNEFYSFLCDDSKYIDIKKSLAEEAPVGKALLISSISGAIGATLGFSAALLTPVVALLLYLVAKMGMNAYCKTNQLE